MKQKFKMQTNAKYLCLMEEYVICCYIDLVTMSLFCPSFDLYHLKLKNDNIS